MLASIEKLRKLTICDKGEKYTAYLDAGDIADEIEREIAEKYMELPVDVDGVPVKIGDMLEGWEHPVGGYRITVVNEYDEHQAVAEYDGKLHTRHINLDQVSELLNNFLEEYDASTRPDEEIIAKYAAKIREAVSANE